MKQHSLIFTAIIFSLFVFSHQTVAFAEDAEKTLETNGLKKNGVYFQLNTEKECAKLSKELVPLKRKMFKLNKDYKKWLKHETDKNKYIKGLFVKRQRLRTQMAATNSYNLQLKIATRLDGLADQIIVLEKDTKVENGIKAARAKYHAARELFIEQVIKLRKTQKQVKEKYADLAANNEIKKAIDTYNETADKKIKLGPSRGFLVSLKKAKALEDSVLSGTIKLREEHDSLYVNAVFNGHYSHELVLDTGATSTALSWATAKKLGLTPGPGARQIKLQLADGRLVDGYSVMAKSIRVGKFTVKNVEVVVFEQRLIKASDLLGISFLKHFNYKIDSTTHKLVMSKVETKADKRARESEEKENSKSKN